MTDEYTTRAYTQRGNVNKIGYYYNVWSERDRETKRAQSIFTGSRAHTTHTHNKESASSVLQVFSGQIRAAIMTRNEIQKKKIEDTRHSTMKHFLETPRQNFFTFYQ